MLIFDALVIGLALLFVIAGLRARPKAPPPRGSHMPSCTNGDGPKKKRPKIIDTRSVS